MRLARKAASAGTVIAAATAAIVLAGPTAPASAGPNDCGVLGCYARDKVNTMPYTHAGIPVYYTATNGPAKLTVTIKNTKTQKVTTSFDAGFDGEGFDAKGSLGFENEQSVEINHEQEITLGKKGGSVTCYATAQDWTFNVHRRVLGGGQRNDPKVGSGTATQLLGSASCTIQQY